MATAVRQTATGATGLQNEVKSVTSSGASSVSSVTMVNSIRGQKIMQITLDNTASVRDDAAKVCFFPGVGTDEFTTATGLDLPAGCTFSSPHKRFTSYKNFIHYLLHVATFIAGVKLEVNNVAIFDGYFEFEEIDPAGDGQPIKFFIEEFKQPMGETFAKTMRIPAKRLKWINWCGQRVTLPVIPKGGKVTYYFPVLGWNKARDLMPLKEAIS